MRFGGEDDDMPPPNRVGQAPALVWMMLGILLVLAFIAALVIVFEVPALRAASRGAVDRAPAPPPQVAPAKPTPTPPPSDVG